MSKCNGCINLMIAETNYGGSESCILINRVNTDDVIKCTHFEEKPEDTISKPLASARLSTSCKQPSNHGRKGTMPRSRKGCFKKKDDYNAKAHEGMYP